MSGFKDCVNKDRRNVFLNLNFFAETVRVEGVEIPVVIDNDELKKEGRKWHRHHCPARTNHSIRRQRHVGCENY